MSIFDGANEAMPRDAARGETQYLNQFEGTHNLRIERAEVSKNGTHIVVEFAMDNETRVTALYDLSPRTARDAWKRDRALGDVKSLAAAALKKPARKMTQQDLEELFVPGSALEGQALIADVKPNENGFKEAFYRAVS